ncbi:helix-turn-helix domain-containing protein [Streptomyces endophyticus]|uniref:Helix-turn-helix transcriptional regulator n=1 Tax=Streptomyces endophyticus TaxID=714166 RepID=A0ABU6EX41_9ACTN|nr:helix-turn-helix transcriptional regulator [Streptomyces endophyticus]MEB8335927.1 helix-turn-helix transcriptional regulator [Streptomyces endophyticus]
MDHAAETRAFLTSRRAGISPQEAGLPAQGTRRVPGLRRAEVARLAGISVEYYARLERGDLSGVSDQVLDSLARALRLSEHDRTHLESLARTSGTGHRRRRPAAADTVRPNVQHLLDSMTGPAFVVNGCGDVLAANAVGRILYAPMIESAGSATPNHARFTFLDPRSHQFWGDWESAADNLVALLHAQAGRGPYGKGLTDLVAELSTHSQAFRTRWADHDILQFHRGAKVIHHPDAGLLHLSYETLDLPGDGLILFTYGAEPGSDSEDALRILAGRTAAPDHAPE